MTSSTSAIMYAIMNVLDIVSDISLPTRKGTGELSIICDGTEQLVCHGKNAVLLFSSSSC